MKKNKINLRKCNAEDLEKIIIVLEEKVFRKDQIMAWIWNKGVDSIEKMKNIPEKIRNHLTENFFFDNALINKVFVSKDKTVKFLFRSYDDLFFEAVLIPSKNRLTACLSTQVGCQLACKFCESGKTSFSRNLNTGEIFDQLFLMNKWAEESSGKSVSNIVIMGMGEPLLNLENTLMFVDRICADYSFNYSPGRITLSTAGIPEKIKELAKYNKKINLAISLHSAINKKRNLLMPVNRKYDLQMLKNAIKYYYKKTQNRITYEYLLLKDINDSLSDAAALAGFTKITPCKINIIEYNETSEGHFKKPRQEKLNEFCEFLKKKNLVVNVRKSKGADIGAACGQLAKNNNNFIY